MSKTMKKIAGKIIATTKKSVEKTSEIWKILPKDTKTGTKLIGAEIGLLTASSILRKGSKTGANLLSIAGTACYVAGMYKLYEGTQEINISVPKLDFNLNLNTSANTDDDNYPEIDHDQF